MTQRCFVFEWICAGACEDNIFAEALIDDGRAMLTAVAADVAKLPATSTVTLSAVGPIADNVEIVPTNSSCWRKAFDDAVAASDVTLVIAPEFAIVGQRLLEASSRFANCSTNAVKLFSDKLAAHARLCTTVPMPSTVESSMLDVGSSGPAATVARRESSAPDEFVVLKPRDGVGEGFRRFASQSVLGEFLTTDTQDNPRQFIAQSFIDGEPKSIAAIVGPNGYEIWPTCEQRLVPLGDALVYGGGRIHPTAEQHVPPWLGAVLTATPGLSGYVSIDFIESQTGPVFIELNPRISVSYIGYRAATDDNLAEWLLGQATRPVRWKSGCWTWTKHGNVTREA